MKRLISGLALLSVIMIGAWSCDKAKDCIWPESYANCWVFISTIPGEETIILAQSGINREQADELFVGFESEYGEGNVSRHVSDPYHWGCDILYSGGTASPDCYEFTLVVDLAETAPDLSKWFMSVQENGSTGIYKYYSWAFAEKDAERVIPWMKNLYKDEGDGEIVSATKKNLGPYVENRPITF